MKASLTFALFLGLAGVANAQFTTTRTTPEKVPLKQPEKSTLPTAASQVGGGGATQGGSDSCATPVPIAGQGLFPYNTTGATTGAEGQAECGSIRNDEWFNWTADATGVATVSTCGNAAYDTKLAAYPDTGGCPANGTSLACNDDFCSLQSTITFPVTNGTVYLLQAGAFSEGQVGASGLSITISGAAGNDDCSTPDIIAGQGNFGFDTTSATTGAEGQNEANCFAFSTTGIDKDLWYEWTADDTGIATMATCGNTGVDTKIAAYPGTGCPVDGSSLACNDDTCGLQSQIQFNVSNGSTYTLQVGSFPGASGGIGSFDITISGPATNDDCASPEVIAGQGNFPFDTTTATTGAEGQNEGLCFFFSQTGIDSDVWFEWTADDDGRAKIQTCNNTGVDTKVAVYPGTGCPIDGSAIACNDDACGLQSTVCFDVSNGTTYTIQLGSFPGASGGVGSIDIEIVQLNLTGYQYDDGVSEDALGNPGGGILWAHAFDADGGSDSISQVSTTYGTPVFPNLTPGRNAKVLIYDDPTNDYILNDAVLLYSADTTTANEDTDIFNDYAIPSVAVNGVFWIAILVEYDPGQFPAPMDLSCGTNGRAWVVGNTPGGGGYGSFDFNNLNNNDIPPLEMGSIGFPAQWLLRAEGGKGLGTKYCSANANSTGSPADISASGSASSAAGDLTLTSAPVPNENGIFFHGASQSNLPFGNGILCTVDNVRRGNVIGAVGNTVSYTYDNGGARRSVAPFIGTTRNFQHWTRDPMGGGSMYNTSNAISIDILP